MLDLIPYRGSLLGRDIFDRFDRLFEDFELPSLFEEKEAWVPAFDVIEKEKEYVVTAEVPGIDPKDIDITISNGILTIKGEKKREQESKDENYYYMERQYGTFQRSFRLPDEVKTDEVDAKYKNGVLTLVLPKAHVGNVKKIEIKQ
ncbi:MAG: Hsp20/alpha crystallin family protein [Deltaproteobacteria bacterium]|nr:MAG: Hsp20/alpha crystallin family protein [Deltaproteobacteria bacterium]